MVELRFNPGDYVQLKLAQFRELEGTALESHDKSIVLLKLRSGYNIGIPKENILGSKILKKFKDEKREYKLPSGKGKPKIGMIITGGTIAAKLDSKTGGVHWLTDTAEFAKFYPKLFEKVDVKKIEVPFMMASENMSYNEWAKIAESVEKMLNDKDIKGVIITHGTDTLHYTAAALSFFLRNLNKPVVLTYSQRSIDRASSDAELNLQCAVEMALSDCAEVVLVGHASMDDDHCHALIGTKTKKMHTSRRDAFKSVNIGPLAKVWKDNVEFLEERRPRNDEKVELDTNFSDKIALVKFYPGQDPDILDYYKDKGYKGIIIEATGLGHVASSESKNSWVIKIKKLIKEGVIVCAVAQTIYGRLNPKVYSLGRELEETGVIFLEDMLAETAFVKLGWVLGHRTWKGKEKEKMLENFAREFNELLKE
ncbi:Glu-tRNA(Gln) amidotransferase GatDE subunit D [Candidatus Pacearchaeota archaeon CG10_big_fil_rev_8_21_14_0_10_34_76]|nr:MAG: Glu-tRNA(Gln) amidotransferase GatDE subunit D [Candidatus Pacearchaeota archaeon CG10_big_fil_rev_8_21_14_0_10_34_76]